MKRQEKSDAVEAAENLLRELENHRDSLKIMMDRFKEQDIAETFTVYVNLMLFRKQTEAQIDMVRSLIGAFKVIESEDIK